MSWYGPNHKDLEEPFFVGIPTFMKLPLIRNAEELRNEEADIATIGEPFDDAVSLRPGARYAPRQIRQASSLPSPPYERYNLELNIDPFGAFKVYDYGDVPVVPGDVIESHNRMTEKIFEMLQANVIPLIMGGDHSVAFPNIRAYSRFYRGNIGIIHFDTHADTFDKMFGFAFSHGSWGKRILELPNVKGKNFVQIGLRGFWPQSSLAWMKEQGIKWFSMNDVEEMGIDTCVREAIERAKDGTEAVYLSFDIDAVDPGYAPGTGTPEPGGLTAREAIRAVRLISKAGIDGMEVVEVSPPYDVGPGITSILAFRLLLEVLCGLALRKEGKL